MAEEQRIFPELFTEDERERLLKKAEYLWKDLQKNNLGGYSGINRPFHILNQFKEVIEEFGRRDAGLHWSRDELEAAKARTPAIADVTCPVCKCAFSDKAEKTQSTDPSLRCNSCGVEFFAIDSQCGITVTAEQYDRLCEMLDAPPKDLPGLRKLLSSPAIADGVGVVTADDIQKEREARYGVCCHGGNPYCAGGCMVQEAMNRTPRPAATDEG